MVPELIRGGTQHTAHSFFEIGRAEFELFLKERTNWYFKNYIDGMDGLLGLPFLPSLLLGLTSNYFKRVRGGPILSSLSRDLGYPYSYAQTVLFNLR